MKSITITIIALFLFSLLFLQKGIRSQVNHFMKSQLKYIFPFLLLLFIAGSCKKDLLPSATQKGANTFGCKINGAVFIPHDVYTYPVDPGILATYNDSTKKFTIFAIEPPDDNKNGLQREVYIEIVNPTIGQNNFTNTNYAQVFISVHFQPEKWFQSNNTATGTLNISRFDITAKIVSGTFSFDAAQRDSLTNVVHVTDGRFDITYK